MRIARTERKAFQSSIGVSDSTVSRWTRYDGWRTTVSATVSSLPPRAVTHASKSKLGSDAFSSAIGVRL